jgi:hypothetical protein
MEHSLLVFLVRLSNCVMAASLVSRWVWPEPPLTQFYEEPSRPRPPWKVELVGKGTCT